MIQHINEDKSQLNLAFGNKAHVQWEFLKLKIK